MLDPIQILHSLEVSVLVIVIHRLIEPGMIFGFWGKLLARKQWDWPTWVRNPLGDCFTCFSGQIGLWTGIALEVYHQAATAVIFEPYLPPILSGIVRVALHTIFVIYFADRLNGYSKTAR